MKRALFVIVFVGLSGFQGCRFISAPEKEIMEGTVTYRITYPENNPYKNFRALPNETQLFFKNSKATFITSGFGIIQLVNLLDIDQKKYTNLLINNLGENIAFIETAEDVRRQENSAQYTYEFTEDTKMIAGLECKKAIVKDEISGETFPIYYNPDVKVRLGNSPLKDFDFLLMQYSEERYSLPMQLEAVNVDFSAVDTSFFSVQGNYRWVKRDEFLSVIKNLKLPV